MSDKKRNRLVLSEEQTPTFRKAGDGLSFAPRDGYGFSTKPAAEDMVELIHKVELGTEPIYLTRHLFEKIARLFETDGRRR